MDAKLARSWLTFSPPVAAAQAAGRPIVALESTIIAHGMPYPQNVRTAREVEAVIRDSGAQPATIALIACTRSAAAICRPCWQAVDSARRRWRAR